MAGNTLAIHQNLDRPGRQMCAHSIAQARVEYRTSGDRRRGSKSKAALRPERQGEALGTSFL